jgi:hypothetical protein
MQQFNSTIYNQYKYKTRMEGKKKKINIRVCGILVKWATTKIM